MSERLLLWHGSDMKLERFEGDALKGHVHLGSFAQARMRSAGRHIHLVDMPSGNLLRVRDTGSESLRHIAKARKHGYDGLVYLNRYEGIAVEEVNRFHDAHPNSDPDRLSDAAFRRHFPSARDSYISIDPHDCRIIAYIENISAIKGWDISTLSDASGYRGLVARSDADEIRLESGDPAQDVSDLLERICSAQGSEPDMGF